MLKLSELERLKKAQDLKKIRDDARWYLRSVGERGRLPGDLAELKCGGDVKFYIPHRDVSHLVAALLERVDGQIAELEVDVDA
jgi:hypothetical protein